MRAPLLLSVLCGCALQLDPTSFGQLEITGDDSASTPIEGLSLGRVSGTNAPACSVRLFDDLEVGGGDSVFLRIEIPSGRFTQFVTGAQPQGPTTDAIVRLGFGFHRDNGFKEGDDNYSAVAGTADITAFDAQQLTGSFAIAGERSCLDMGKDICTAQASGTFEVKNEGCVPPL
jgi:hypothetical protein